MFSQPKTKIHTIMTSLTIAVGLNSGTSTWAMDPAPQQKEYLVVLLHGLNGTGDQMNGFLPLLHQKYQTLYPNFDVNALIQKFDFFIPTAHNSQWFTIPGFDKISDFMNPINYIQGYTDKIEGFRQSLIRLNYEIDEKLKALNLGRDRLILGGLSQGGITASTLACESHQPVLASISAIGMWIPSSVNSYPKHMLFTHGAQDTVIPGLLSSLTGNLLKTHIAGYSNLQIQTFPEDAHGVSDAQITTIVKFLHENIFEKGV